MNYRQLGKDGADIPVIGLGAWPIGGGMGNMGDRDSIDTVRTAIDSGITLLDTAQAYRTSEATLGRALKDGYRERCFLATKVSRQYSRGDIENAIENSLRNLDVDYVDLYQIHSWNPQYPIEESMETMARLQEQGKTRFIGVSNFNAAQMQQAYDIAPFHSNQPRYNMFDRNIEAEDLDFCRQTGIGILAHSPLGKGLLTGKYASGHVFSEDDERANSSRFQGDLFARYLAVADELQSVAADKNMTMVQLAIAWLLRREEVTCVLVGAKNPDQVKEHVGAADVAFSDGELECIEKILQHTPSGF
ncbi:MAG: aldo/keto reductase [Gemmatimonadetes bacterium]|nr:aldo/keto reductase [Gemmatimonadota bacterium]MYB59663.1 aldo/keto reductase [Gemmatimonadota bacterium]